MITLCTYDSIFMYASLSECCVFVDKVVQIARVGPSVMPLAFMVLSTGLGPGSTTLQLMARSQKYSKT